MMMASAYFLFFLTTVITIITHFHSSYEHHDGDSEKDRAVITVLHGLPLYVHG
jgi:hypothetical protein